MKRLTCLFMLACSLFAGDCYFLDNLENIQHGNSHVQKHIVITKSVPEQMIPYVEAGLDAWNYSFGYQVFNYTSGDKETENRYNLSSFDNPYMDAGVLYVAWVNGGSIDAGAVPFPVSSTFSPLGIYINGNVIRNRGDVAMQITIHEAGHVLGYNHTSDSDSIMKPSFSPRVCPPITGDSLLDAIRQPIDGCDSNFTRLYDWVRDRTPDRQNGIPFLLSQYDLENLVWCHNTHKGSYLVAPDKRYIHNLVRFKSSRNIPYPVLWNWVGGSWYNGYLQANYIQQNKSISTEIISCDR